MRRRWPVGRQQGGQMLVGVMVLLAIVFLLGSAMALGVSSSLHRLDQGAAQDAARYGAEAAVARGLAAIDSAPTQDGCQSQMSAGMLDGQMLLAKRCNITAVDAGPGKVRYSSNGETVLASGQCVTTTLQGGGGQGGGNGDGGNDNGSGGGRDVRVWTSVAWRSTGGSPAEIDVFVDSANSCDPNNLDDDDSCAAATATTGPLYFQCSFHMDPNTPYSVRVVNLSGGPASVSPFVVREANSGHDCVATVIGQSAAASDEGDLILPGLPVDTPTGCGLPGAHLGIRNRLLP
jgi:hypothetical protein